VIAVTGVVRDNDPRNQTLYSQQRGWDFYDNDGFLDLCGGDSNFTDVAIAAGRCALLWSYTW